MSSEGFRQYWCKNGHQWKQDYYEADIESCPHCGKSIAFAHSVDQTNGYMNDAIETEVVVKAKMCKCKACGHKHEIAPAQYRIPTARDVRNAGRRRRAAEQRQLKVEQATPKYFDIPHDAERV